MRVLHKGLPASPLTSEQTKTETRADTHLKTIPTGQILIRASHPAAKLHAVREGLSMVESLSSSANCIAGPWAWQDLWENAVLFILIEPLTQRYKKLTHSLNLCLWSTADPSTSLSRENGYEQHLPPALLLEPEACALRVQTGG